MVSAINFDQLLKYSDIFISRSARGTFDIATVILYEYLTKCCYNAKDGCFSMSMSALQSATGIDERRIRTILNDFNGFLVVEKGSTGNIYSIRWSELCKLPTLSMIYRPEYVDEAFDIFASKLQLKHEISDIRKIYADVVTVWRELANELGKTDLREPLLDGELAAAIDGVLCTHGKEKTLSFARYFLNEIAFDDSETHDFSEDTLLWLFGLDGSPCGNMYDEISDGHTKCMCLFGKPHAKCMHPTSCPLQIVDREWARKMFND